MNVQIERIVENEAWKKKKRKMEGKEEKGEERKDEVQVEEEKKQNIEEPEWLAETKKWLEQDEALFEKKEWWKEFKKGKDCAVYSMDVANSPLKYFKAEGNVQSDVAELRSLLDTDLVERQKEWFELLFCVIKSFLKKFERHHLLIEGNLVEKFGDDVEVLYFAYKSTVIFVSPRDTLYVKVRKNYPPLEGGEDGGFLLSYRTIQHKACPEKDKYVRIEFKAAHRVTPDKEKGGVLYQYTQFADPKGN